MQFIMLLLLTVKVLLTVYNLAAGSYDVVAKFNGNDKYLASQANATFAVLN